MLLTGQSTIRDVLLFPQMRRVQIIAEGAISALTD
jgi:aspartyl-tRNA synthetase